MFWKKIHPLARRVTGARMRESVVLISLSLYWLLGMTGWAFVGPTVTQAQETPTSTPDAEGNIYVIVQPNDSLWSIAARAGISLPELLELNGIDRECRGATRRSSPNRAWFPTGYAYLRYSNTHIITADPNAYYYSRAYSDMFICL